jgi:hydrogenase expression/formation protein HypC
VCLAVPGEILEITDQDPLTRQGRVRFGGAIRVVNLSCVPKAGVGDFVLVHVGVAISTVDPAQAERTFRYLRELGELAELEGEA